MKKSAYIYLLAILILDFISLADISHIINISGHYRDLIYIFAIILFIFKIINSKYKKKYLLGIIIFGIISLYISIRLSDYMFLTNFLIMIGIIDVDFNKVVKVDMIIKIIFIIIHSLFYFHDYFFNYSNIEQYFVFTKAFGIRHSLYFSHPNTAAAIVIWLIIDWIYISKNKKRTIIIGTLIVAFYSYFTISRTALIIYILFLIILFLLKKNLFKNIFTFLEKNVLSIMIIINIIVILTSSIMNNSFMINLDKVLSKRLTFTHMAISTYGIHFLPNNISESLVNNSLIVDNFYSRSFISYGFIVLILLVILYRVANRRESSNLDKAILIIFPIYLMNELFPFNIGRAICMLIIANMIFNKKLKTEDN